MTIREASMNLPTVVVAGRPNVGKSALVNRIVGKRQMVVEEEPGVTRDVVVAHTSWSGVAFRILDTGGFLSVHHGLEGKVAARTAEAVLSADLVLLVGDVVVGVTDEDLEVARLVKRSGCPVVVVANKADNDQRDSDAWSLMALGLGEPVPVSAVHGRGVGDLLDIVVALLGPTIGARDEALEVSAGEGGDSGQAGRGSSGGAAGRVSGAGREHNGAMWDGRDRAIKKEVLTVSDNHGVAELGGSDFDVDESLDVGGMPMIALAGRPNVGKSTLFNRMTGGNRSIVHDVAGTTRDVVDTVVDIGGKNYRFLDTAGMRHKDGKGGRVEHFSVLRALDAVDAADVVLLVIDAASGVTQQDARIASRAAESGSPVVVVLNKWDLVPGGEREVVVSETEERLAFLGDPRLIRVSAAVGTGVAKVMPAVDEALAAYRHRIPTGELNRAVHGLQERHPCPGGARIKYAVQGAAKPPTVVLFASKKVPVAYQRYIEGQLRSHFGLERTPLKIKVRIGSH